MSSIEFQGVCKRYEPHLPLTIHNADLQIGAGEFCVFVGPSGCGKSTLLRMVAGLETITSGTLTIDGVKVNDLPPAERGVAMVFQSYALYPHMTVEENMSFGLKVMGADKAEIARKVKAAADILQLTPLLDRLPKALSGGQRQRVAIGRAIVKEPKVFLFDEPLSNLDTALRVQTRVEIAKLHRAIGTASMIYVTHDQVEAMTLADKIVLLHAGDLVQQRGSVAQVGSPMALYHQPASVFVAEFIGSPKMNLLRATLRDAQADMATVELDGLTVQVAVDARHLAPGAAVRVGLRPEHCIVVEDSVGDNASATPGRTPLPVQVTHVERLGDATLIYASAGTQASPFTIKTDGHLEVKDGEHLRVWLAADQMHLFDDRGDACRRTVDLPR